MKKDTPISNRKADHIQINLERDVRSGLTTGLETYRFIHQALPEMSLSEVDMSQSLFNRRLPVPVLISSMTGGTTEAERINRNLAAAAQAAGLAMGVGSQRAALQDPSLASTFQVRDLAPDILLFANLGAVQLNYGFGADQCRRAVEMIEADALILHLNPLQEALQPEGDVNFTRLIDKIAALKPKLEVPLVVKEVGWGFSRDAARQLFDAGVDALDVAGAGGTSWSQVEMHRIDDPYQAQTAAAFIDWGIPTAEALLNARSVSPDWPVFASGGLRSGLDVAKCLALGANLGGLAGAFLKAAVDSQEAAYKVMKMITNQIRIAMFACGARTLADLSPARLTETRTNP